MSTSGLQARDTFEFTDHALGMARQRGVSLAELAGVLADRRFVVSNSKKDPEGDTYVLPYRDPRIVWTSRKDKIVVLTVFSR